MEPEEKFKISLINLEKKILDLESVVGELSGQVKEIGLDKIRSKIEELEDLTMVSNLALLDLKRRIEEKKLTDEELQRIVDEVKPDVAARLVEFKKEFAQKIPELGKGLTNLKKETNQLRADLKVLDQQIKEFMESPLLGELDSKVARLEMGLKEVRRKHGDFERSVLKLSSDFRNFRKKISQLEERDIKKILSEISSSRGEFSREIREVREQLESLMEKTSGIDVALLSSKFNNLKESVDYLLNRKVETDMKLRSLEDMLSKIVGGEGVPSDKILKGLEKLSERLRTLEGEVKHLKVSTLEELNTRVDELERSVKMLRIASVPAPEFPSEVIQTIRKMKELESRVRVLESVPKKAIEESEVLKFFTRIKELERNVRMELFSTTSLLKAQIGEIRKKLNELENRLELQAALREVTPRGIEDRKIREISEKITELEGKISAIEKLYERGSIILE